MRFVTKYNKNIKNIYYVLRSNNYQIKRDRRLKGLAKSRLRKAGGPQEDHRC